MENSQICYVAFLDILGFRNFVMKEDAECVRKYLSNLVAVSKALNIKSLNYDIRIFSDSIIISVPVEQSGSYIADRMFLSYINSLLLANIVDERLGKLALRGAVTKGEFFTDNNKDIIFGKALIAAYELEKDKAKDPRVIIDTNEFTPERTKEAFSVINNLLIETGRDKEIKGGLIEFSEFRQERCRDSSDGLLYCNYLSSLKVDGGWMNRSEGFIERHRSFIVEELKKPHPEKDYKKYVWMKTYHNWFCSGVSRFNEFMIN